MCIRDSTKQSSTPSGLSKIDSFRKIYQGKILMSEANTNEINDVNGKLITLPSRPSSSISGVVLVGLIMVCVIFVGLGIWSATAPLARAVPAMAKLSLKGERKTIQHFEGGMVGSLHVAEGELVEKGQLLISLDPLKASANVARHNSQ